MRKNYVTWNFMFVVVVLHNIFLCEGSVFDAKIWVQKYMGSKYNRVKKNLNVKILHNLIRLQKLDMIFLDAYASLLLALSLSNSVMDT